MKKAVLFILIAFLFENAAFSLDSTHFTINRITAPYFIVDGNAPSTVTRCYVGFEVINKSTSATTYQNLVFSVPNIGTSVAGQNYSILAPLSNAINIGTLAPGQSKVCYFYVNYPANTSAIASFNTELTDGTPVKKNNTFSIYNRSSISANAGGASQNSFNSQNLLGGIIIDTVTYTVGNVRNGDETDFQVATTSSFDPTKLQLFETRVVQSTVAGIRLGTSDSLYFITGNGGVGSTIRVIWKFRIVASGFTTNLLPLAGATSGSTNYKYALNTALGSGTPITIPASANKLTIQKFSDQDLYCSSANPTARFTIRIQNAGLFEVSINTISDTLPTGFRFIDFAMSSQINKDNSVFAPSPGNTGAISFEAGSTTDGSSTFVVPAGGQLELIYDASVPLADIGVLTSGASASIGSTSLGFAIDSLTVSCALPVKWLSFDAVQENNNIRLNWSTSEEINTQKFEIRQSNDGTNWTVIGSILAAGNSQSVRKYNFLHIKPSGTQHFYQLKEISHDGSYQLSRVVKISSKKESEITVYPTFVTYQEINVVAKKATSLLIIDASGKVLKNTQILSGLNKINLSGLAKGSYYIKTVYGVHSFILN